MTCPKPLRTALSRSGASLALVAFGLASAPVAPAAAAGLDLGDAPTGGASGGSLPAPAVTATFPSGNALNAPRHAGNGRLRLGVKWKRDDGVSLTKLKPCATSEMTVL